jgi:hypothetical protein
MIDEEQQPLEIEVRKWDAHSFTIEGINDQLEKLLKEQKIIRTLALMQNGKMVRISRDVRLKARKDFYFTPEVEETTDMENNTPYHGTTFEYEGLD